MVIRRPERNTTRRALCTAVALCAATFASSARADGMALSRFEPSERGSRFFLADSLELDAKAAGPLVAAGVASTYAWRTRVFGSATEGARTSLVEHAFYLHPGGSVVIAPGARFAVDVPIAMLQSGRDENLNGTFYRTPSSPRLGDVRAGFDLHLFGPTSRDEQGIALAGGVSAWLPTGSTDEFTGDEGARFGVHVASAARFGAVVASARAGYMYRRDATIGGSQLGSEVDLVLGLGYSPQGGALTVGPELRAVTLLYDPFQTRTTPVEAMLGAHGAIGPLRAGLGVGTAIVAGLGAPELRVALSIEWTSPSLGSSSADRDHDGVPDSEDVCPDVPGLRDAPPASRGCPPAPSTDSDESSRGDRPPPDGPPIQ
jgi:hypothetical protein